MIVFGTPGIIIDTVMILMPHDTSICQFHGTTSIFIPSSVFLQFVFYSAIREDLVSSLGPDRILQDVLVEDPSWDDETRQLWNQAKAANPDKHRCVLAGCLTYQCLFDVCAALP